MQANLVVSSTENIVLLLSRHAMTASPSHKLQAQAHFEPIIFLMHSHTFLPSSMYSWLMKLLSQVRVLCGGLGPGWQSSCPCCYSMQGTVVARPKGRESTPVLLRCIIILLFLNVGPHQKLLILELVGREGAALLGKWLLPDLKSGNGEERFWPCPATDPNSPLATTADFETLSAVDNGESSFIQCLKPLWLNQALIKTFKGSVKIWRITEGCLGVQGVDYIGTRGRL